MRDPSTSDSVKQTRLQALKAAGIEVVTGTVDADLEKLTDLVRHFDAIVCAAPGEAPPLLRLAFSNTSCMNEQVICASID